ncbi:MAG: hypothetical protein WC677_02610 [Clostridia bacterium]|jgi:hypothetical protein
MKDLYHVVNALVPVADAFAGTVQTAPIHMKNWQHASFLITCGAGAVGTSTITVEACDTIVPGNVKAIPFSYQECVSGDTFGEIKQANDAGFATAAAANKIYKIEVDEQMLASTGYGYVRVKAVEVVNDPVTGGIVAVLTGGRFESEVPATAIV